MSPELSPAEIYGREFPAGAVVFEEGDPGSRMYVIHSGEVRIVKRVGAREVELARLGPGEAFGEMALLERQPRSATAVVDRPALRARCDALAAGELSEVPDLAGDPPAGVAAQLLHARLGPDGGVAGRSGPSEFDEYLSLRRRFEPDEGGRDVP
jgi:hypothetical protein